MKNTLRTPWTVEPVDRWPTLFTVYDCDGSVLAAAKSEEVAQLIAAAPVTRALLDAQLKPAISVYADPRQYNLDDWLPSSDPYFSEDEGDEPLSAEEEDELETKSNRRGYHVYVGRVDGPDEGAIEDELLSAEEEEDFGWGE